MHQSIIPNTFYDNLKIFNHGCKICHIIEETLDSGTQRNCYMKYSRRIKLQMKLLTEAAVGAIYIRAAEE